MDASEKKHFCWKKCYDMTKVWDHSKGASLSKEGREG